MLSAQTVLVSYLLLSVVIIALLMVLSGLLMRTMKTYDQQTPFVQRTIDTVRGATLLYFFPVLIVLAALVAVIRKLIDRRAGKLATTLPEGQRQIYEDLLAECRKYRDAHWSFMRSSDRHYNSFWRPARERYRARILELKRACDSAGVPDKVSSLPAFWIM